MSRRVISMAAVRTPASAPCPAPMLAVTASRSAVALIRAGSAPIAAAMPGAGDPQRLVRGDGGGGHPAGPGRGGRGDGLPGGQGLLFFQVDELAGPPHAVQSGDVAGRVGDGVHQAGDDGDGLGHFHADSAGRPPAQPAVPVPVIVAAGGVQDADGRARRAGRSAAGGPAGDRRPGRCGTR